MYRLNDLHYCHMFLLRIGTFWRQYGNREILDTNTQPTHTHTHIYILFPRRERRDISSVVWSDPTHWLGTPILSPLHRQTTTDSRQRESASINSSNSIYREQIVRRGFKSTMITYTALSNTLERSLLTLLITTQSESSENYKTLVICRSYIIIYHAISFCYLDS